MKKLNLLLQIAFVVLSKVSIKSAYEIKLSKAQVLLIEFKL
jgi:hypothetical protein